MVSRTVSAPTVCGTHSTYTRDESNQINKWGTNCESAGSQLKVPYKMGTTSVKIYSQDKNWTGRTDFEALGMFHSCLSLSDQMARTKFIFDQWHTATKRLRVASIKESDLQHCPCCRTDIETTRHILQCTKNSVHDDTIQAFRRPMS